MFQKIYTYAFSVNWQFVLTLAVLLIGLAFAVAAQFHGMPQETLVAVNWNDKVSGTP